MFTGIVDHVGEIQEIETEPNKIKFTVYTSYSDLTLGESIAIDGVCLTVTTVNKDNFTVEISPETMCLTTAAQYQVGKKVNLERSLRLLDRLGGHFVTGHIDGLCELGTIQSYDQFIEMTFSGISKDFSHLLVKKGSIAINGVSLTINEVNKNSFKVMLIPHTLQRTNLADLSVGTKVNIEYDYLAKLVYNQIKAKEYEKN